MGQIVKSFADGSYLEYDYGKFDGWCVYLTRPNLCRRPPKDVDYFYQIKQYAQKYGVRKVYNDFVKVYLMAEKNIEMDKLTAITEIAASYGQDAVEIDIVFSILYMAMIAEERKENAILGKRIKRLGIHLLLWENCSVEYAAHFMRGKKWREIDGLCRKRGF